MTAVVRRCAYWETTFVESTGSVRIIEITEQAWEKARTALVQPPKYRAEAAEDGEGGSLGGAYLGG